MKLLTLVVILASTAFAQSPLDAPGEKKITVRSEIKRGATEVTDHVIDNLTSSVLQLVVTMNEVIARNQANRTDSDGFMLGARFSQWHELNGHLRDSSVYQSNSQSSIAERQEDCRRYFSEMRELQKKLGLNDDQLIEAVGVDKQFVPEIKQALNASM
jgi:hypothetical protein